MMHNKGGNNNNYGLDTVNISLLSSSGNDDGTNDNSTGTLPLVMSPRWDSSLTFLSSWCRANRMFLDEMLCKYGAVLVRGFNVQSAADMERAVEGYEPCLNDTYRGTSPRKSMPKTDFVFSAAEVPVHYPIAQHLEMSFLASPPRQLFFGCLRPSAAAGGETALCDFRRVARDISPELAQKFLDKGIRYTRTHRKVGSYWTYDVSDMLGWPELFGTSDKGEVERLCAAEGLEDVRWEGPNGDTFVHVSHSDAFQLHPLSREPVWFNHTQVFHWTTGPSELWYAVRRTRDWRLLLHAVLVTVFCFVKYGLFGHETSLHATFGDGTPISRCEMNEIRTAVHRNMVFSRWQKGDLLFIDNFSTSHGRQPTYDKGRTIAVAWSDPLTKTNECKTLDAFAPPVPVATEFNPNDNTNDADVVCMENPQERTPESTLTEKESMALKDQLFLGSEQFPFQALKRSLEATVAAGGRGGGDHTPVRSNIHKRCHSQPTLTAAVHSSDFWKKMD